MSDYYYGQGKLYLARRNTAGQALSWRWVGDVSAFNIELDFDEKNTKASVGGKLVNAQRFISGIGGKITSTWHEFSADNLQTIFNTEKSLQPMNLYATEQLPAGVVSGDRISLKNQNVWGVSINGLTVEQDYVVDGLWGVITFLSTPASQPVTVEYQHPGSVSIPLTGSDSNELSLRYEGINLAESGSFSLIEIYRISFDPISKLSLINTESELNTLETTASILHDLASGTYGRIVTFNKLSGITHNGSILHDGIYTHRG